MILFLCCPFKTKRKKWSTTSLQYHDGSNEPILSSLRSSDGTISLNIVSLLDLYPGRDPLANIAARVYF
jgi:hypothetical protein